MVFYRVTDSQSILGIGRLMNEPQNEVLPACTQRQLEAMELLANGLSLKQAALKMGIRMRSVSRHINRATWRLNAKTRTQLIARAVAIGIIKVDMEDDHH